MNKMIYEVIGSSGTPDETAVRSKYEKITDFLIEKNITVTAMESCTSGQIASLITDTEGASAVFKGSFVTYSNEAKIQQGVSEEIIRTYGVYSPQTACEMARVCKRSLKADIGIGITGSFGNKDPENEDSVPGQVYFAFACDEITKVFHCEIPEQPSRFLYKLYIADVAADQLHILLGI